MILLLRSATLGASRVVSEEPTKLFKYIIFGFPADCPLFNLKSL